MQKSKGNKFAVEYSAFVDDKVRARVRVRVVRVRVRVVRVRVRVVRVRVRVVRVRVRANPNPKP